MSQPTGHPVSLHRSTHRFRYDQTDPRPIAVLRIVPQCVHDEVGLRSAHPLTDRGTEFSRPRHPVSRRKHNARSCVESRSQLAATLGPPARHDRPACPSPHPQPEPVHTCAAPVVRLKSPLALGHGCLSSFPSGARSPHRCTVMPVGTRLPLVSSSVSLSRRGPQQIIGSQPCRHVRATVRGY